MKATSHYICNDCGGTTAKWQGQCPHCNNWNTLQEEKISKAIGPVTNRHAGFSVQSGKVEKLGGVKGAAVAKRSTGINELDRVLGGGLVRGGVVLLGGDPGVGKSTLLLQVAGVLSKTENVLYISGEESAQQIAMRGERMAVSCKEVYVYAETELDKILSTLRSEKPDLAIIDSIQTTFSAQLAAAPGSVSQVKECSAAITRFAKETGTTVVFVGHVTKDGTLAGPRVLEHIVDTVLYFEGEQQSQFRLVRGFKNRFGSVNELGVFSMSETGLTEVSDPSGIFMINRTPVAGSAILAAHEGNRSMMIEVQALVDESPLPNPKRLAVGLDQNRLAMLIAILHKYMDTKLYGNDVFVSVVGGVKLSDTAIDLAALAAMISSFKKKALPKGVVMFGEIGLTGEIRHVSQFESRIKEASRLGFQKVICPDLPKAKELGKKYGILVDPCRRIEDAIVHLKDVML